MLSTVCHLYGAVFLPCLPGIPQVLVQAAHCSGTWFNLNFGRRGRCFPKTDPAPPGAHIIGEDGQLPALQHVLQFFVGRGPAGCGEKGFRAWAHREPGWQDGAGTREPPFPGLRPGAPPTEGQEGVWGRPGIGEAHALISSCRWIRSLQRSRYLDWVALYSVITSTNFRESVECLGRSGEQGGGV